MHRHHGFDKQRVSLGLAVELQIPLAHIVPAVIIIILKIIQRLMHGHVILLAHIKEFRPNTHRVDIRPVSEYCSDSFSGFLEIFNSDSLHALPPQQFDLVHGSAASFTNELLVLRSEISE